MSCKNCQSFIRRKEMKADDSSQHDPGFYNIFKQPLPKDYGRDNGCTTFAFFIPVGEEDKMEICGGEKFVRKP